MGYFIKKYIAEDGVVTMVLSFENIFGGSYRRHIIFVPLIVCILGMFVLLFSNCTNDNDSDDLPYTLSLPEGFPAPPIPTDNPLTEAKVQLGKQLFYDKILSRDSSVSCASCHYPELSFSDHSAFSTGVAGRIGTRNAPPLANIAYSTSLMRDGGVPTLEKQIIAPLMAHNEMDFSYEEALLRLQTNEEYRTLAQTAYQRPLDAHIISQSIAAFERTLLTANSLYDRYIYLNDSSGFGQSAQNGLAVFDRLDCDHCHSGFNFTDYSFENIGLYLQYPDSGRYRVTLRDVDIGKFRTPSLRNVAATGPYMHDGSIASLSEVIDFYATGGLPHPNKNSYVKPFVLSPAEKQDLIHFLEALTDNDFLHNPKFLP